MAVGEHGKAVQTSVRGQGPKTGDLARHVAGSGDHPGTGSASGWPTPQASGNHDGAPTVGGHVCSGDGCCP
jgi:hypothetical protein